MFNRFKLRKLISGGLLPLVGFGAAIAPGIQPAMADRTTPVSVELMLSIDVSGSVDSREYNLQMDGYAGAFRDQEIIDAITSLPDGLAVSVQFWARRPAAPESWKVLRTEADVKAYADYLDNLRRPSSNTRAVRPWDNKQWGNNRISAWTGIAYGLQSATTAILNNEYDGEVLVIDISGDGRENVIRRNRERTIREARDRAVDNGITVNGLPIDSSRGQSVAKQYRNNVIGGENGFAEVSNGFADFTRAVKTKLEREITDAVKQLDYCNLAGSFTNDDNILVTIEDGGAQVPSLSGGYKVDFDDASLSLNGFEFSNSGTTYSYEGNYTLLDADRFGGADSSRYIVNAPVETNCYRVRVDQDQKYFGFWWSAGDSNNKLTFRKDGTVVAQFVTEDLKRFVEQSDTIENNAYYGSPVTEFLGQNSNEPYSFVNIFFRGDNSYDEIIYGSTTINTSTFESDNHVFSEIATPDGNRITNELPTAGDASGSTYVGGQIVLKGFIDDPDLDLNTDDWNTEQLIVTLAGIDVAVGEQFYLYKDANGELVGSLTQDTNNQINYVGSGTFTLDSSSTVDVSTGTPVVVIEKSVGLEFFAGTNPSKTGTPGYEIKYEVTDAIGGTSGEATLTLEVKPVED